MIKQVVTFEVTCVTLWTDLERFKATKERELENIDCRLPDPGFGTEPVLEEGNGGVQCKQSSVGLVAFESFRTPTEFRQGPSLWSILLMGHLLLVTAVASSCQQLDLETHRDFETQMGHVDYYVDVKSQLEKTKGELMPCLLPCQKQKIS